LREGRLFSRMGIVVAIADADRVIRDDGADIVVPWWSFTKTLISAAARARRHNGP